jgi:hypothetical protein
VVVIKVLLWIYQCHHHLVNNPDMVPHLMVVVIKMKQMYNDHINKMFSFKKFLHIKHQAHHMLVDNYGELRILKLNHPNQHHIKLQLSLLKIKLTQCLSNHL